MVLFDPRPKTSGEELFDREEELEALGRARTPITLLLGIRRIGKSSVLRVFINEAGGIYVDARAVYFESGGWIRKSHLIDMFQDALNSARGRIRRSLAKALRYLEGVKVAGLNIRLSHNVRLLDILRVLDREGLVLGIDEAQYLRFSGSRGGREILALLAYAYDNLKNLRIILSGSEVGLLYSFLGIDRYESPLYGRSIDSVTLHPFPTDTSIEFLERGFREQGLSPPREHIEMAVLELDGIPGWLVDYGLAYLKHRDHRKAMEEVYHKAEGFLRGELGLLRQRSPRYTLVLRKIAMGYDRWSLLTNKLEAIGKPIPPARLAEILKNLERMGWIKKTLDNSTIRYVIVDPVIERILRKTRI